MRITKIKYMLLFALVSCAHNPVKTVELNEGAILQGDSLLEAEKLAKNGSHEFVLKLIAHYRYGQFDLDKLLYWLEFSARMGDANSARGAGAILIWGDYSFEVTKVSCERGGKYLQMCAEFDVLCNEDYIASKEICKNIN